jgi:hypothetical protein
MKTKNKVFIGSGIFLLLVLIVGYGLVSGYGPWGEGCGGFPPGFPGRGFHSAGHHKEMSEFILWRMEKLAQGLNLTEVQKAKYEELKNNLKSHLSSGFGERQRIKAQFMTELNKENPDMQGVVKSVKTKINDHSGFLTKNLDLLANFYDSLDNAQKRSVNQEIRERMAYHHS